MYFYDPANSKNGNYTFDDEFENCVLFTNIKLVNLQIKRDSFYILKYFYNVTTEYNILMPHTL